MTSVLKEDQAFIGREKEIQELTNFLKKRKDVLLVGHLGTGKTAILRHIYSQFFNAKYRILYIEQSSPLKEALVAIAYQIHDKYRDLRMWEVDDSEIVVQEWKDIKRKIIRMRNKELAGLILKNVHKKDYFIILDHLERVTPTSKAVFEVLLDKCCIVGSYSGFPKDAGSNLRKLWWRFKIIEIRNLTKDEAIQLIDYYFEKYNILSEDPKKFKRAILKASSGNPLAIKDICYLGSVEKYVSNQQIRELDHQAGTKYLDMAPVLILGICGFVMLRFFALGLNDTDTYVFAGGMGAIGLFIRFILFRYFH